MKHFPVLIEEPQEESKGQDDTSSELSKSVDISMESDKDKDQKDK